MANPAKTEEPDHLATDGETDYGSEIDFSPEEEIKLLTGQTVELVEDNPIVNEIEHHDPKQTLQLQRVFGVENGSPLFQAAKDAERVAEQINEAVALREHYPNLSNQVRDAASEVEDGTEGEVKIHRVPSGDERLLDTRSPLERFRTQPHKTLSVTDLISPAWCELQYWYALTIHGRKRRTPAMKQGSRVHKKLEEQVHATVRVDVQIKEDKWGLRIWNIIQGLRTLRATGLTRELEIWCTIDGLVVNGVIDELTYTCPDTDLEESLKTPVKQPPPDQTTISEFFKSSVDSSTVEATRSRRRALSKKVYICDVKTRSARTLPTTKGATFRPTKYQLMLYHHLLSALATNTVDFSILTTRYNLDPDKMFSDSFIAQVGSLNDEIFYDAQSTHSDSESTPQCSQDSMETLLAHNSLSALWSLMITEFQLTLPDGADSLGKVLKAEYRSRGNAEIMGSNTFLMHEDRLKEYVDYELKWWRGERPAEGVVIEEAFKCRSCEYAEGCVWRLAKIEEAREKARLVGGRKRSAV